MMKTPMVFLIHLCPSMRIVSLLPFVMVIMLSCLSKRDQETEIKDLIDQIYVSKTDSKVLRPEKELKAFEKISLEPGQEKKCEIDINIDDLAYFNEEIDAFEIETGKYTIHAGSSSNRIKIKEVITINQ